MATEPWRTNERWEAVAAFAGATIFAAGLLVNWGAWEGKRPGWSKVEIGAGLVAAAAVVVAGTFLALHSLFGRSESERLRTFGLVVGSAGAAGAILGLAAAFSG